MSAKTAPVPCSLCALNGSTPYAWEPRRKSSGSTKLASLTDSVPCATTSPHGGLPATRASSAWQVRNRRPHSFSKTGDGGVPSGRLPTTHILKPPTGEFDGHAENEHFCLQLARSFDLPAASSEMNATPA